MGNNIRYKDIKKNRTLEEFCCKHSEKIKVYKDKLNKETDTEKIKALRDCISQLEND